MLRYFDHLIASEEQRLFEFPAEPFTTDGDNSLLALALGATLYSPATRPTLAKDIAKQRLAGVMSVVVCLEDAIPDDVVEQAQQNTVEQLRDLAAGAPDGPMVFVRVRHPEQIRSIVAGLGQDLGVLTGFVLPKFTSRNGQAYLDEVVAATQRSGRLLRVMPVLESPEVVHAEVRVGELLAIRDLLHGYRDHVLALRTGGTDLSSTYGLRRTRELTIYDIRVVADALADIVNVFGRADGGGYLITGPVWEYFPRPERLFKPQLRESPFRQSEVEPMRAELLAQHLDGLIREVVLDRANGFTGKTVIHPSHVAAVHALSVVTHEEFSDATDVLSTAACGGAAASAFGNKMNESKPHKAWAERIVRRARVFGVARPTTSFVDLLGAGLTA